MKKVAIIGGGISGVFAAIRIKEKHSDYEVSIFEHNDKLLKKIYATGNGKCNFANLGELTDKYNNERFVLPIINDFDANDIICYFNEIGVASKNIGNLVYPYSESAVTVADKLLKKIKKLGIDVHLKTEVKDYRNNELLTDSGTFSYDALIISVGGKSSPKLGSTGSFFPVLSQHNYKINEFHPSLCPIKTKENTKSVEGLRHKVVVSLYNKNKCVYLEEGELLFKKDGLSGMVIFNMSHYINLLKDKKNVAIHVDFAKDRYEDYYSLLNPKLADYLSKNKIDIHNAKFTFKSFYDFDNSQVSSGGVDINEVDKTLQSKKEKNVYFIGEALDVDAVCGGYNIMWALSSAEKVSENI